MREAGGADRREGFFRLLDRENAVGDAQARAEFGLGPVEVRLPRLRLGGGEALGILHAVAQKIRRGEPAEALRDRLDGLGDAVEDGVGELRHRHPLV